MQKKSNYENLKSKEQNLIYEYIFAQFSRK